jgi:hypothetical protein
MGRDFQLGDKLASQGDILQDTALVSDQFRLCQGQLADEPLQVVALECAFSLRVECLPHLDEIVDVCLIYGHTVRLRLAQEGVNNDSDEEI